jgi:hypothetical protein
VTGVVHVRDALLAGEHADARREHADGKDLMVDPVNLPTQWPDGSSTAGLGYVASAGGRVSEMRSLYISDPYYWATCPARTVTLEPKAAADAGEEYRSWRERRDVDVDDQAEAGEVVLLDGDADRTTRDAILTALRTRGRARTGVLADAVAAPLPTVSSALRRLEREGHAVQVRHGEWACPTLQPEHVTSHAAG